MEILRNSIYVVPWSSSETEWGITSYLLIDTSGSEETERRDWFPPDTMVPDTTTRTARTGRNGAAPRKGWPGRAPLRQQVDMGSSHTTGTELPESDVISSRNSLVRAHSEPLKLKEFGDITTLPYGVLAWIPVRVLILIA